MNNTGGVGTHFQEMRIVAPDDLEKLIAGGNEYALLDVREAGEAEKGHIAGSVFVPRRQLEFRLWELIPNRATRVILYDSGGSDKRAALAFGTLKRFGYINVAILKDGATGWQSAGHLLVEGSNVPSKFFGEYLLSYEKVPELTAEELAQWKEEGRKFVLCDIRTPEEHKTAHIPGARPAPSFEIARLIGDFMATEDPVIVHCAGRTRSILAAQTLRVLGLENTYAMKNGTMGWVLAGHELREQNPEAPLMPTENSRSMLEAKARELAGKEGICSIAPEVLADIIAEREAGDTNSYIFDVRALNEFLDGHIPGSLALPGGQAVQRADEFVAVGAAPIYFIDDAEGRAVITAFWFRQMGYPNTFYLRGGLQNWTDQGRPLEKGRGRRKPIGLESAEKSCRLLTPQEASTKLQHVPRTTVLNVDHSRNFSKAHIEGSQWLPRGFIEQKIEALVPNRHDPILLTCRRGDHSCFADEALRMLGYKNTAVLAGGIAAWEEAGLPTQSGTLSPIEAEDLVLPPYARGEAGMERYLAWEEKLTDAEPSRGS